MLKIVQADPTERAQEYRPKSMPIGFEAGLKLTVLPGISIQHGDGSKPRKLPRLTTKENPILWRFAETLGIRISELKTRTPPSLQQYLNKIDSEVSNMERQHGLRPPHDSAHPDISSVYYGPEDPIRVVVLGVRISRLEEIQRIKYNFERVVKTDQRFACPDTGCTVNYGEAHRLNEHWRGCHGSAGSIVVGKVCYPCRDFFESTRELILHEKKDHAEEYDSRIELYWPFFKQSQCEFDRSYLMFKPNMR